ncbi:MAG: sulfite exporter TauE/SafE family protein [Desulfuromonadales bacterium]|nr:sulfite exporter TauE/SafE family protein [Desulfuromonadales bacterium]
MPLSLTILTLFILLGALAGFLAGLLGIGGGIILVPLFLWALPLAGFAPEVMVHSALGTSLAIILPTAVSSTWGHRRRGNVNWHQVYRLASGVLLGTLFGAMAAARLPGVWLQALFGVMQILVGLKLFFRPRHLPPEETAASSFGPLFLVGALTGGFSAFFGVGGGVIAVPLMILFLKLPTPMAVGNSSALIAIASLAGAASYAWHGLGVAGLPPYSIGYVNLLVAVLVAPSAILLAPLGVRVASRLGDDKILRLFSILLILIGAQMAFKAF